MAFTSGGGLATGEAFTEGDALATGVADSAAADTFVGTTVGPALGDADRTSGSQLNGPKMSASTASAQTANPAFRIGAAIPD